MSRAWQVPHGWMLGNIFRLKKDIKYTKHVPTIKGYDSVECTFKAGDLVKVVMVSRFLDCGITDDLQHSLDGMIHYKSRVSPVDLEDVPEEIKNYKDPVVSDQEKKMYRVTRPVKQVPQIGFDKTSKFYAF